MPIHLLNTSVLASGLGGHGWIADSVSLLGGVGIGATGAPPANTGVAMNGMGGGAGDLFGRIWPYLLALLVIAVVGGLFAMWLRRRIAGAEEGTTPGFTLHDLRQMHNRGDMTAAEFERAKAAMLAKRPSREEMADKLVKPKRPRGGSGPPSRTDGRESPPRR